MDTKSYILLANREKNFLETVGRSLTDAGYSLLTATAMSEALDLVSSNSVVLVVSDSELADGSGYDFLDALKNSPALKEIDRLAGNEILHGETGVFASGRAEPVPQVFRRSIATVRRGCTRPSNIRAFHGASPTVERVGPTWRVVETSRPEAVPAGPRCIGGHRSTGGAQRPLLQAKSWEADIG